MAMKRSPGTYLRLQEREFVCKGAAGPRRYGNIHKLFPAAVASDLDAHFSDLHQPSHVHGPPRTILLLQHGTLSTCTGSMAF
jgi:hypothetical protein